MAGAAWWLLQLSIAALNSLPLVEFPENLLKDAQLPIDRMSSHASAPALLIHPQVDDLNLVDWLVAKETVQEQIACQNQIV